MLSWKKWENFKTVWRVRDFYTLDAKIDEVARALGVMDFGMDTDVTSLSGGQRTKVLLAKAPP